MIETSENNIKHLTKRDFKLVLKMIENIASK